MLSAIHTTVRTVKHQDRLTTVGHLDELRTRLIASLVVIGIAFGFGFWQNNRLLQVINRPLAHQTQAQVRAGHGPLGSTYTVAQSARDVAVQLRAGRERARRARPAPDAGRVDCSQPSRAQPRG